MLLGMSVKEDEKKGRVKSDRPVHRTRYRGRVLIKGMVTKRYTTFSVVKRGRPSFWATS